MAQLVEHHLAKVRVAGSNPVVRSAVTSIEGSSDTRGVEMALDSHFIVLLLCVKSHLICL